MTEPIEYKIKDYTEACDVINQMIGPFEMLRMVADCATQQPDATFAKMEISAYVKAKVEAVWS